MHEDIKKYADEGNIKELKYKFSSSLDVDPTFEKYKDDFDYCCRCQKKVFEEYKELTPIENKDQSKWNKNYWANLKQELIDNFSKERLEHMIQVAKVIYKDKIERLERERLEEKNKTSNNIIVQKVSNTVNTAEEQKEIERLRQQQIEEQKEIERLRQQQIEEAKKKLIKENESNNKSKTKTDEKKGKKDYQSLKPSNNEGNIAGSKAKPTQQNSSSKKEQISLLPKTNEEQVEEAKKKLNEENKVTDKNIQKERKQINKIKQIARKEERKTKHIANSDPQYQLENCLKNAIKPFNLI